MGSGTTFGTTLGPRNPTVPFSTLLGLAWDWDNFWDHFGTTKSHHTVQHSHFGTILGPLWTTKSHHTVEHSVRGSKKNTTLQFCSWRKKGPQVWTRVGARRSTYTQREPFASLSGKIVEHGQGFALSSSNQYNDTCAWTPNSVLNSIVQSAAGGEILFRYL